MSSIDKITGFDKDFLWLFHQVKYPAICLSLDYSVVALTLGAEKLFAVKKKVCDKPINSLFFPFGLDIIFSSKNKKLEVRVLDKGSIDSSIGAKRILLLNWKIRPKKANNNKTVGFIIYAEEQENIEYLTQIYRELTGRNKRIQSSAIDYTDCIKNHLEDIIACMPGNVYWLDKDLIYLGCNDNNAKFFGLKSRKEIIGKSYKDFLKDKKLSGESIRSWLNNDLEIIRTGKPKLNIEERLVLQPGGQEIFYLTNLVPIFDDKKNVIGILGVSYDITERKLMERELQRVRERAEKAEKELLVKVNKEITGYVFGEEKSPVAYIKNVQNYLENIIACLPGNVFWLDKDLVYLGCNDNNAKFCGLKSRKEIVGLTYPELEKRTPWLTPYIPFWRRENLEVIATGKPKINLEFGPIVMPNGEVFHYLVTRVPLFDDKNTVIGVLGVSIDISERKRVEKLQNDQGVAEKTAAFMRMLGASIAHELRTPLAIIGINSDLLMTIPTITVASGADKETIEKHFKSIKHAIKLASFIIDNMLVMLKTLSSGAQIKKGLRRLSIADDLKKFLENYPFIYQEKSLISVHFNKINDFTYRGDRTFTMHMLFNLVRNAMRAIKEAEKGKIKIILDEDGDYNVLRFVDTALGISDEELPGIFEQFMSAKHGGAGLGLAFCKAVMHIYGGDVTCKSKFGEYTEFTLKFPKVVDS